MLTEIGETTGADASAWATSRAIVSGALVMVVVPMMVGVPVATYFLETGQAVLVVPEAPCAQEVQTMLLARIVCILMHIASTTGAYCARSDTGSSSNAER